jgi:outer membrane immunogenic protein
LDVASNAERITCDKRIGLPETITSTTVTFAFVHLRYFGFQKNKIRRVRWKCHFRFKRQREIWLMVSSRNTACALAGVQFFSGVAPEAPLEGAIPVSQAWMFLPFDYGVQGFVMKSGFIASAVAMAGIAVVGQAQAQSGSWKGFYAGINGGYNWSDARQSATPAGAWVGDADWPAISRQLNRSLGLDGAMGGIQAGYNMQSSNFVFGVEADMNWLNSSNSYQTPTFAGAAGGTWNASGAASINWLATLRARAGITTGNSLFYITGGLALVDADWRQRVVYLNVPPPIPIVALPLTGATGGQNAGSGSDVHAGLTLGAGVEFKLDGNWSLKGEYLFVAMGKDSVRTTYVSPVDGGVYSVNHQNKFESLNIARIGLNYKFN